jgi:hypothetical protein
MKKTNKFLDITFIILLFIVVSMVFISISPYRIPVPHRDSGIFLQIGSEILRGKVLYQQLWDIKQPLVFFINAFGLWLGRGSLWGVWGLEYVFFLTMLSICYRLLRTTLSSFKSFFIVFMSFIAIFQFISGNFTEEYALLFQMGILAILFFCYLPDRSRPSRNIASLGIGLLIGLVFCIKQTYLDIGISVLIYIIFLAWVENNRQIVLHLMLAGLGFIFINFIFIFYFFKHDALNDYITFAFLFNRYYLSLGLLEWIHALLEAFEFISSNPILVIMGVIWLGSVLNWIVSGRKIYHELIFNRKIKWVLLTISLLCWLLFFWGEARGRSPGIGILGWSALIMGVVFLGGAILLTFRKPFSITSGVSISTTFRDQLSRSDWIHPGAVPFLFLGVIDLPLVLMTITLSGRNYTHYFISLFPALFLLFAGGLKYISRNVTKSSHKITLNILLFAILLSSSFTPLLTILTSQGQLSNENSFYETAVYLNSVTDPQEKILVWGWESVIYFLADREPATRYAFQFPAYFDSPYKQIVLTNLLEDIKADPPLFIADTLSEEMPLIEGRPDGTCLSGSKTEEEKIRSIISYVCMNYEFDRKIGDINIYGLK